MYLYSYRIYSSTFRETMAAKFMKIIPDPITPLCFFKAGIRTYIFAIIISSEIEWYAYKTPCN